MRVNTFVEQMNKHSYLTCYRKWIFLRTKVWMFSSTTIKIWSDSDRASSLICANKRPTRCNRLVFYCKTYCLLNMFRAPLCPSSGAREYYTDVRCLWYLMLWFSSCRYGVELRSSCSIPQTGHITLSSTPYRQLENQNTKYDGQRPSV